MYFFECIPAGFQTVAMNSITDCFKQLNFLLKCEIMRVGFTQKKD